MKKVFLKLAILTGLLFTFDLPAQAPTYAYQNDVLGVQSQAPLTYTNTGVMFYGTAGIMKLANAASITDGTDSSNSSVTINASINIKASQTGKYVAKTANYTVTASDYAVSDTLTGATYLLPTAVGKTGQIYIIKNLSAGTQTVNTTSSQRFDGSATSKDITTKKALYIMSSGAGWIILSYN
jgi:hypothetical protein